MRERITCSFVLLAIVGIVSSCSTLTPAEKVLLHRQTFSVSLKSWTPRDKGVLGELQIVPAFKPKISTLTVRVISFDEAGEEEESVRIPLDVTKAEVGLPLVVRRMIPLAKVTGGVGVEIEANPEQNLWHLFPELANFRIVSDGQ